MTALLFTHRNVIASLWESMGKWLARAAGAERSFRVTLWWADPTAWVSPHMSPILPSRVSKDKALFIPNPVVSSTARGHYLGFYPGQRHCNSQVLTRNI